jgi:hypothetical protein
MPPTIHPTKSDEGVPMFASPVLLLGTSVATLYAAGFHLLTGRTWRQIMLYWMFSLVGFMIGQIGGELLGLGWPMIGQLHIIPATIVSWGALLVARLLKT